MKLATLRTQHRDGKLIVVSSDNQRYLAAGETVPNLQFALDNWSEVSPHLEAIYAQLNTNPQIGEAVNTHALHAPLPRAYEWIDGSAYINHIVLVRKARNAEPPATLKTDPLVYQGGSGHLLGPTEDIPLVDASWGLDFESEICVILDDIPQGTKAEEVDRYVRLVLLCNDVTLRNRIPPELAKGFGFFTSKPATAFSPFALTLDELGEYWDAGRVHLNMKTIYNGTVFGDVEAGPEMHFSFRDIIAHICTSRAFTAGTIVGSGTISNEDTSRGSSCLSEKRMLEKIATGEFKTPYMQVGDTVEISMSKPDGHNLFGTISQRVVAK